MMRSMTKYIFLDTAAILGFTNKNDQYHESAKVKLQSIIETSAVLITTTHVFAETVTRIQRQLNADKAIQVGNMLRSEDRIGIIVPQEETINSAWKIYQKYKDNKISFVDCVSFAIMKEMKIKRAFTFDKHFQILGFELI